jgi:hypothetical protein
VLAASLSDPVSRLRTPARYFNFFFP